MQAVTEELVIRRKQFKKAKLNWRVSNKKSARRSLGWIPFKKSAIRYADGFIQYGKTQFKLWDSYGLSKYTVKTGSFVEDSRGRWYVCLVVESVKQQTQAKQAIGIDLGLKDVATCSDGTVISNPKYTIKTGSFVEDSRGRWYVCLVVDSPKQDKPSATATKSIGRLI